MYHPWRALRDLDDWTLVVTDLPDGYWGLTLHGSHTVLITRGLTQAERRCTIAHEIEHIVGGPAPPGRESQDELRARRNAAHKLLPDVRQLADALLWAQGDLVVAAQELWVDVGTLQDRLRLMTHPAERAFLRHRVEQRRPAP
jgi:hypothetical protein